MKKILPICYPSITTAPMIANLMSVLETTNKSEGWIANNLLQLVYIKNKTGVDFDNLGCFYEQHPRENNTVYSEIPLLKFCKVKQDIVNILSKNIVDFFVGCIQCDYYIRPNLNIAHFSITHSSIPRMHVPLFYGYDYDESLFYIADFFDGKKYDFYKVSFAEVEDSFINSIKPEHPSLEYYEDILLFKINELYDKETFKPSPELIKTKINDFINSCDSMHKFKNTLRWQNSEFTYGLKYYDELASDLLIDKADVRSLHTIVDYITMLKYRLKILDKYSLVYSSARDTIAHNIDNLLKSSITHRNKYIKIKISGNNNNLQNLHQSILSEKTELNKLLLDFQKNIG